MYGVRLIDNSRVSGTRPGRPMKAMSPSRLVWILISVTTRRAAREFSLADAAGDVGALSARLTKPDDPLQRDAAAPRASSASISAISRSISATTSS
jgi:hypothetical protein